jgi:MFS family permease
MPSSATNSSTTARSQNGNIRNPANQGEGVENQQAEQHGEMEEVVTRCSVSLASPSLLSLSALIRDEQEHEQQHELHKHHSGATSSAYGATTETPSHLLESDSEARERESQRSSPYFHSYAASTVALCLCTLTHAYLLISVFPYAGFLAIDLIPGTNSETAGSYAGLIASMFMLGRTLSSYGWGKLADRYGRSFVIYFSLLSSGICTLGFGLSTTFGAALAWRFCLGLGNGIVGTAKTVVSELAQHHQHHGDENNNHLKRAEKLETRAMAWVMGMWGWGFLVSPALSGALAEPIQQYPDIWDGDSCESSPLCVGLKKLLTKFPFLLPNLLGAILCVASLGAVFCFVPETLPQTHRRYAINIPGDLWNTFCQSWLHASELFRRRFSSCCKKDTRAQTEVLPLNTASHDTENGNDILQRDEQQNHATIATLWARNHTRRHLIVYWAFSTVAIALEEIFPLFCISKAGLGVAEVSIGKILSLSGLLYAIFQIPVYSFIVHRYGVYGSIRIGLLVSTPLIILIPITVVFNHSKNDDATNNSPPSLTLSAWVFAGTILAIYRIFTLVFFSSITVATNRTVSSSHRGTMNGLSALGGSAAKGIGPFLSGCLFAFWVSSGIVQPQLGMIVPFAVIGFLGFVVALSSFSLKNSEDDEEQKK